MPELCIRAGTARDLEALGALYPRLFVAERAAVVGFACRHRLREKADVHRALAGIALPNPASVALHDELGFEPVGVLPRGRLRVRATPGRAVALAGLRLAGSHQVPAYTAHREGVGLPQPGEGERFSVRGRVRSFGHAFRGLGALLAYQHNARIHAAMSVAVVALGAALGVTRLEWALLALAIAAVWAAEALNTAIEALCDRVSPEHHPLVERAKDAAAAGVLLAAFGSAAAGLLVLGPRLVALALD